MNDGGSMNKLNRILQLTGFSDPIYAEAYVTVQQYDIVPDVYSDKPHKGYVAESLLRIGYHARS